MGRKSSNYKSTPLLDDGVLYIPWVNHGMAAVDAGTGKTLWTFEPQPVDIGGRGASLACTLARLLDGRNREARLSQFRRRPPDRGRWQDGQGRATGFGSNGWIDLRKGLDRRHAGD